MEKFDFFKYLKPFDLIVILGVAIALAVGFLTFKQLRQTADKQIETTSPIVFDVFLRGITLTGSETPLKAGDKTFISIRNVPYSDLEVVNVKTERKKTILPVLSSSRNAAKNVLIVDDVAQNSLYDIVVTLTDTAKITKDGAVVGGNKIKMGLPITLEGGNYKFNGTVSNVVVSHDDIKSDVDTNINKIDDVQ